MRQFSALAVMLLACGGRLERNRADPSNEPSPGTDRGGSPAAVAAGTGPGISGGAAPTSSAGAGATGGASQQPEGGIGETAGGDASGGVGVASETPGGCPAGVLGHCREGATYPFYEGYTLTLVEDFAVPLDLNLDPIWTWSDGSTADTQTSYRERQIAFADGYMTLTAESPCEPKTTNPMCIPAGRQSYAEALAPNSTATIGGMGVWSGELRSKYNNFRYGRYEVKYAAPIANPGFEATKTMSGAYTSTLWIHRSPKNVWWNQINIELEPNHFDEVAGNITSVAGRTLYPGDAAAPFVTGPIPGYANTEQHEYAFAWTPTQVEWFLDGQSIHTETNTARIPIRSAKIMMNLWVFSGDAFGDAKNNKYPFSARYDWFRFYKLDAETTYPCTPAPYCLPPEDKTQSAQNNPNEANYGQ